MGLQGTLQDLGVLDLLQLPYNGKKTCQLTLTSERGRADIYYEKGKVVHACFDDQDGEGAIEEIMDWDKASFEIGQDVEPPARTITKDLHSLLLFIVKSHDEKMSAGRSDNGRGPRLIAEIGAQMEGYLRSGGLATYLSIIDGSGDTVTRAKNPEKTQEMIGEVERLISYTVNHYPRKDLRKAFYEDDLGIVSIMRISDSWTLVALSERNSPLGAVSLGLNRLAAQIAQKVQSR